MVRASPLAKAFMSPDGAPPPRWRFVSARCTEQQKLLKLERASHTATVVNGNIYVIAGRKGSTFYGDLLRFNTVTYAWSILFAAIPNGFRPRANHTATLVDGRHIWVIAGSDNEKVIGDVHVFDVHTQTWTKPHIRGDVTLLSRTAHSAELHPCDPRAILLFGGYDGAAFHNDLIVIRTDALTIGRVELSGGGVPPPVPRGYHSCTAAGSRCYVYGGRTEAGVVDASEMLAVYDAAGNCWLAPQVEGKWPQARSSHRAMALGSRLLIHGGAAAGEQTDRLSDVHTLLICPHTGRLTWSRIDEPPAAAGSTSNTRPQGRSAHTISLVGVESIYVMCGYVGAHSWPHRYSGDVFQLLLGVPICEQSTAPQQPQPSPQGSPPHQLRSQQRPQLSPQHIQTTTDRSSPRSAAAAVVQGAGGPAAPAGPSGVTNSNPSRPASPLHEDAVAAAGGAPRPSKRGLVAAPSDAALAQAQPPAPNPATPTKGRRGGGGTAEACGAGVEDDPIDLTVDQPPGGTPPKGAVGVPSWAQPVPRTREGTVGENGPAVPVNGGWLGGNRRGRGCGAMQQQQVSADTAAAVRCPGAHGTTLTSLHGHPLAPQARGEGADGRAAKRHASDAAVGRGRLPVQAPLPAGAEQAGVGVAVSLGPAAAAVPAPPAPAQSQPVQQQQNPALGSGLAHGHGPAGAAALGWQAQAQVYGLTPGTIAAAATAAATAAVAATTAAGSGAGVAYLRPPSSPNGGVATNSREALLQLLQDNQGLLQQLQEAKDAEWQVNQKLAAQQEQQRRAAEELSTQRRSCEMTQAALRTANTELEDARSQLEHLQQDLVASRHQAAAHQQQQAAAAEQAADRERAQLQERSVLMQQLAETGRKHAEQVKSLEALCGRHQAEADKYRRDLRAEAERHSEEAAALSERLGKREQDAAELTNRLRESAAQNQKLQQELGRLQDMKQRLERDISEAREAQQRLQRQMDEQVGDLARQRDSLQMQFTHANTRISALESELRRSKDDLAHRDVQHAALLQASADKAAELAGLREQLRAAQQKQEVMRQQAGLLVTQMQTVQATAQAIANGS